MDDRHVMRLIKASERIAASLERIDRTLAAMHESDPVKLIGDALAAEVKETPQNADPLAHIPEGERYRFQ